MPVRYSGDTEIRVRWDKSKRRYEGSVRDPKLVWRGHVSGKAPGDSDAYDDAAYRLYTEAARWARTLRRTFDADIEKGRVRLRRVFQAPCPLPRCQRKGCA